VFATRPFSQGELVMRFEPGAMIDRGTLADVGAWEREHLAEVGIGQWRILPEPRCYLNHACDPNAVSMESSVIALRGIAAGDEVTIDYRLNAYDDGTGVSSLACRCDPARGPHRVIGDFFSLPPDVQLRYLEWAPPFIRDMYARKHPPK
jgi:hypothetical protein